MRETEEKRQTGRKKEKKKKERKKERKKEPKPKRRKQNNTSVDCYAYMYWEGGGWGGSVTQV